MKCGNNREYREGKLWYIVRFDGTSAASRRGKGRRRWGAYRSQGHRVTGSKGHRVRGSVTFGKFLYAGLGTCFGQSTQGAGTKTHLKSRWRTVLILYNVCWTGLSFTGSSSGNVNPARVMGQLLVTWWEENNYVNNNNIIISNKDY